MLNAGTNEGASAAVNYADILNESWDNIQEVVVLPIGSWLLRTRNASLQPPKTEGGNPSVLFVYEPKEPMQDVDQEALDALGADYNYSENRVFFRVWLETGADKDRLRQHIMRHGVDLTGMSIGESLKAVKGTEVVAYLSQKQITNKGSGETRVENDPQNFVEAE